MRKPVRNSKADIVQILKKQRISKPIILVSILAHTEVNLLKTEHLDYFIDIAASGSLSKTAERFFTSHQVVKKAVKNLEDELMVKLITTSNQGSELTEAGDILLTYAQQVVQLTKALKGNLLPYVQNNNIQSKKILELCMTPYLTDSLVLAFIDDYQMRNPELEIRLQSLPAQNIFGQITNPHTFVIIPTIEEAAYDNQFTRTLADNQLDFFVLAKRPLYICTYEKTEWAEKSFYTSAELDNMPLLVSSNITLNTEFFYRRNQQMVNSVIAQKNLIKKGQGVSIVTAKEFAFYFKNDSKYTIISTDLEPVWYICVHQKAIDIPDYIRDFLAHLVETL